MATLTLNFTAPTPIPDAYDVRYREKGTSGAYTFVTVVGTPPLNVSSPSIIFGKDYEVKVISDCTTSESTEVTATSDEYEWILDTYTCDQDSVYTLTGQVSSLSSPFLLYYDSVSGLVYGVDHDKNTGNFFRYNPNTLASPLDIIYTPMVLQSGATNYAFNATFDAATRRLFAVGRDTNGVQIFNIATGTVNVVVCGNNHNVAPTGLGNGFNRTFIRNTGNYIITYNSYNKLFYYINKSTLNIDITKSYNFGANGQAYMADFINNEIWVCGSNLSDIYVYDSTFTTQIATISLSAYSALFTNNVYWKSSYYDPVRNRLYMIDLGGSFLIVINTQTKAIVFTHKFDNRLGKGGISLAFIENPVTGRFYISGILVDDLNNPVGAIPVTYEFNRDNNTLVQYLKNLSFTNLTRIGNTNKVHGAFPGSTAWAGGAWATDGIIRMFIS